MKNEGEIQNLRDKEAIEKIKELVKHTATCLFTTKLQQLPLRTRPMATQQVDEDGNLWFFSAADSDKNEDIAEDPRVQLFYANQGSAEFLSVYGFAEILRDKTKIEELWTPVAKAWFENGKEDPVITVLKIEPEEVYYWDTKNGKVISMVKILASAVSGNHFEEGVEGKLEV